MLLEQYGRFKKAELEESPFRCLLNTNIEINPHQINAFCAAIQALKTGGIVLADEVGLGKTIEAGLTLKYVLDSGAKHVLIALPATLRKQWEVELEEKFNLQASILDRLTVESNLSFWKACLENRDEVRIVITSYDYSSKLMQRFPKVKWDFIIIDEAHNLRNVFHGTKRAKRLYELSKGIPKILLTATPLQNSLSDLHGLISFIDPRIFGSEKVFNKRFIEGQDYTELKRELIPVLYRTLRRDVGKYMDFKKRECRTIDFVLSPDEVELYMRVNNFLKKDVLYSIPNANKGLIVLVIRKLLASSSYALIETFEVLKNRLQKLYEGTKSANAQDGFDLFWNFVEDEIDESGFEEIDDEDTLFQKQQIQVEIDEVDAIIETASRIQSNAKVKALKTAIHTAFEYQEKQNIPQKVVVFTESKRTQKYIASELRKDGFEEDDILFRKYVGVCAPGQSVKTTLLRMYAIILQTSYQLAQRDEYKNVIDPYYSLVGYYNSIRELGGAVRLLQDDIPKRIYRIKTKYNMDKVRYLNKKVEITSRMSSYEIPNKLRQLEATCDSKDCLDTAVATNMIAVGMDVDRLGLMVVTGQPKQNSEYIQATSRIGRAFPGLVFTLYNPYRPRDLSHYENFTGYHSQLYRFVEGTTATPFSARARDRVMHALIISAIRLKYPEMASNERAADIAALSDIQMSEIKALILDRLNIVKPEVRLDAENEIDQFIDWWKMLAAQGKPLRYYVYGTDKYNRLMNYYGQSCKDTEKATLRCHRNKQKRSIN